jgi:hypothetical protein
MRTDSLVFEDILEEVPLVLHTSHLGRALLEDLRTDLKQSEVCSLTETFLPLPHPPSPSPLFSLSLFPNHFGINQWQTFDHLDLSTHVFLEKNVRLMMGCIDELSKYTNLLD